MRFLNPLSLLWMAPLAGLVVLMYILKLRRRDVTVSSTFLWAQVIRDVQANSPFQKLRKNLLMYLQLLAVLFLVLAVSRPFWQGKGLGGRSVVVIVDSSASMLATDTGKSRLEVAKQEARKIVGDMRSEDQMMILSAAARPEALSGFTADKSELYRKIDNIKAHETTTNMRDAVNLGAALVSSRESSQLDIVTDGAFPAITSVDLGKTRVVFHPVGVSGHNVGIVAVDYRRSLTGEKTVQAFVTVRNFDTKPRTFNVELLHGKQTVDAHEVTLAPGAENPDLFDIPEPSEPFGLTVKIDAKDDLSIDNQAAMVINPRKSVRTLLVSEGNVFLKNGIEVDPNVTLKAIGPKEFKSSEGYDVVVFDGFAPAKLPDGNYMFVNCSSDQSPAQPLDESSNQTIIDPNKTHPVMRYVDFGNLHWTSMHSGKVSAWGQELAGSENGSAIVAGEKGKTRSLWTGFNLDVAHGQFPLSVFYPIFLSNAVRWLAHTDDDASSQIHTGQAVSLDVPAIVGKVTITKPDGQKRELTVMQRGGVVFDDTDQIGIYDVSGPNFKHLFAANLADYTESDITPKKAPDMGASPTGKMGHEVKVVREMWPWLAGLLLLLIGFEWYAFHRRIFVSN